MYVDVCVRPRASVYSLPVRSQLCREFAAFPLSVFTAVAIPTKINAPSPCFANSTEIFPSSGNILDCCLVEFRGFLGIICCGVVFYPDLSSTDFNELYSGKWSRITWIGPSIFPLEVVCRACVVCVCLFFCESNSTGTYQVFRGIFWANVAYNCAKSVDVWPEKTDGRAGPGASLRKRAATSILNAIRRRTVWKTEEKWGQNLRIHWDFHPNS